MKKEDKSIVFNINSFLCLVTQNDDNSICHQMNKQISSYLCKTSIYEDDVNNKDCEILKYIDVANDNRTFRQTQLNTKTQDV